MEDAAANTPVFIVTGLDPATHRASVRERWNLFGVQTHAGWMAASVGGHDGRRWPCFRLNGNLLPGISPFHFPEVRMGTFQRGEGDTPDFVKTTSGRFLSWIKGLAAAGDGG